MPMTNDTQKPAKYPVHVLYAEDDLMIRMPMVEMLKRRVEKLLVAEDGQEALYFFERFRPDIIITDIRMPRLDGLELIQKVKAIDPDITSIVVSAHDDANYFIRAIDVGVNDFLLKPIDRKKLFEKLHRHAGFVQIRKQEKQLSKILESISEQAGEGVIITSSDGVISFRNQLSETFLGHEIETGTKLSNLKGFPQKQQKEAMDCIRQSNQQFIKSGFDIKKDNGECLNLEIFVRSLQSGKDHLGLIILRDISDHKRKELELIKARQQAEEAGMARMNFLSVMSHEIRTPLNGIIGTTKLLLDEEPREDQKQYLQTLDYSSNHLLSLVNDILDFSKIEAHKIEFEQSPIRISELITNLKQIFSYKASERNTEITSVFPENLPEIVLGDAARLSQILTNLLSNAVKFTSNGKIEITCCIIAQDEDKLRLRFNIKDNGIGIAAEKQAGIFDAFTQAGSNISRQYGGSGLGLNITKKLIELQNGTIGLNSKEGIGSDFYFALDFGIISDSELENSRQLQEFADLSGLEVLLVEDNAVNQMIASRFIKNWNANVHIAGNGAEALEKFDPNFHHIILMDLQMPEMDGFEACQEIRKYNKDIAVIALTASVHKEVKDAVLEAGMTDFISKPFIPQELNRIIAKYTGKA